MRDLTDTSPKMLVKTNNVQVCWTNELLDFIHPKAKVRIGSMLVRPINVVDDLRRKSQWCKLHREPSERFFCCEICPLESYMKSRTNGTRESSQSGDLRCNVSNFKLDLIFDASLFIFLLIFAVLPFSQFVP